MLEKCVKAVKEAAIAAGQKPPTKAQLEDIEARMSKAANLLAREDLAGWRSMTEQQRTQAAASRAMEDIRAEAQKKLEQAELQIQKTAEADERVRLMRESQKGSAVRAVSTDLMITERMAQAEKKSAMGRLMSLIEAAASKEGATVARKALMAVFNAENPGMTRDVVREIYKGADGHTSNKQAQQAARAWLDTIEELRTRFNAAGGDVGKLDYGYTPQPHSMARIRKAGKEGWVNDTLQQLDRSRYLNDDGTRMSDDALRDWLRGAYDTLSSNGANKQEPGAFHGTGKRANRGGDSREIHFADGEAWAAYMGKYGQGSLYDAMMGHVAKMTRDITLIERYGPDAVGQGKLMIDKARQADGKAVGEPTVGWGTVDPATYLRMVTGELGTPHSEGLARTGAMLRNLQTAAKLGGAIISSITDLGTLAITAGYNRLPYWQIMKDVFAAGSKEGKDFLAAHGMIADSISDSLNRFSGDHIASDWSGRMANTVMRLSLMNAWTDGLRQGFTMTMNASLAKLAKTDWDGLKGFDRTKLERAGITREDWAVIQKAPLENYKGRELLTPQGIKEIATQDFASVRPGEFDAIRNRIAEQTAELSARNANEQQWIAGRLDKFDDARDSLNRWVKERLAKRLEKNEEATAPMLERMALLDAQREQAKLHADMEADFNRFATQDEVRTFLNAVEDGASADKTAAGPGRKAVRAGLEHAETVGRRYGEAKGNLERRMREIERRIADMDRRANREADADAKAAQKKADDMAVELREFIERSKQRQEARQRVIDRLTASELPRIEQVATEVKNSISAKLFGFIQDEAEFAVINPDMTARAFTTWGQQAGTNTGEFARTAMQFKSFPTAMITRHWRRLAEGDMGADGAPMMANRVAYSTALLVSTMALGGIAVQAKQMLAGKDPINMNPTEDHGGRFMLRALMQGGGLSILGDLFLVDPSTTFGDQAGNFAKNALGPTIGAASDLLLKNIAGNIWEAARGKDTHWQAELLQWGKSNTPGASLWWLKPMVEHGFLNQVHENLSPGYLAKVQAKARKDWGQRYWWAPDDATPSRAPEIGEAWQ